MKPVFWPKNCLWGEIFNFRQGKKQKLSLVDVLYFLCFCFYFLDLMLIFFSPETPMNAFDHATLHGDMFLHKEWRVVSRRKNMYKVFFTNSSDLSVHITKKLMRLRSGNSGFCFCLIKNTKRSGFFIYAYSW